MGARTEVETVAHPWPVVYEAFVQSLPTRGYRIIGTDRGRGRIEAERRNTRLIIAVGAVDAITSEWVATSELKVGVLPDRHDRHFGAVRDALHAYLQTYYP